MGPDDSVDAKLLRQLCFYFSDSNLPRDKFLKAKTAENEEGYVELELLCTFKRMQDLAATPEKVAALLLQHPADTLALSEDKKRVRRSTPLPEGFSQASKPRTVYAKGWSIDGPEPTIEAVEALFQPFGSINCVRLRRRTTSDAEAPNRTFKGSVFIEFASPDVAQKAAAAAVTLPDADEPLTTLMIEDYLKQKHARRADAKQLAKGTANSTNGNNNAASPAAMPEVVPGLVVSIQGIGPGVSREDLKELMEAFGTVAWIDYARGDADGHVRFDAQEAAPKAIEQLREKKTELGGKIPELELLQGDAEQQYWKDIHTAKQAARNRSQKRKREAHSDTWKKKKANNRNSRGSSAHHNQNKDKEQHETDDAPPAQVANKDSDKNETNEQPKPATASTETENAPQASKPAQVSEAQKTEQEAQAKTPDSSKPIQASEAPKTEQVAQTETPQPPKPTTDGEKTEQAQENAKPQPTADTVEQKT